MPRQLVEFEFPDPDAKEEGSVEVELDTVESEEEPREIEGAVGRETIDTSKKEKTPEEDSDKEKSTEVDDVEIDVVDDTPEKDRGRKKADPPKEVTEDELEDYSKRAQERIKHFSRGYHDERRAKEEAMREKKALEEYARTLIEENKRLKGSADKSHNVLVSQAKKQAEAELALAKREYRDAYEAGDVDAITEAQAKVATATVRLDRVNSMRPREETPLQVVTDDVKSEKQRPEPVQQQAPKDEKAEAWRDENPWFGSNREMTAFALGLHAKLTEEDGIDPKSDEYYEKINSRMRQVFPDQFDDGIDDTKKPAGKAEPKPKAQVVAPATRSTGPKKVTLTKSQVKMANDLGVPLKEYARQVANIARNKDGR